MDLDPFDDLTWMRAHVLRPRRARRSLIPPTPTLHGEVADGDEDEHDAAVARVEQSMAGARWHQFAQTGLIPTWLVDPPWRYATNRGAFQMPSSNRPDLGPRHPTTLGLVDALAADADALEHVVDAVAAWRRAWRHWGIVEGESTALYLTAGTDECGVPGAVDYWLEIFDELLGQPAGAERPWEPISARVSSLCQLDEWGQERWTWRRVCAESAYTTRVLARAWLEQRALGALVGRVEFESTPDTRADPPYPSERFEGSRLDQHPDPISPLMELFELGYWPHTIDDQGSALVVVPD